MNQNVNAVKSSEPKSPSSLLPLSEKVSYGVGDIANGLAVASVGFWLLFYLTEVAGLSPILAGVAIMIGRAWDAVTDPIMGWITDKTNSRWGKRRPYLLFGAIGYALTFFMLWVVPAFESERNRFIYVAMALVLFNTALTIVFVPYTTLTASMTDDYNERTSLTGFRMVASQIAFLIGAALPSQLVPWFSSPEASELLANIGLGAVFGSWLGTPRLGYLMFGALFGLIMLASIWICFLGVRERVVKAGSGDGETARAEGFESPHRYFIELFALLRSCQPFRQSLGIKLLSTCAVTLIAVKLPYYITYVLEMKEDKTNILMVLFISAIASTPVWVMISRRLGKVEAYRIGMIGYIAVLLSLIAIGHGPTNLIFPVAVAAGFCHAAALMIPWTIIPDVVEYDELHSGKRREGLLYGGTAFAYKLASALAVFFAGVGLEQFGYEANVAQSVESMNGILGMLSIAPALLLALSIYATVGYPLTSARHAALRAELNERKARLNVR